MTSLIETGSGPAPSTQLWGPIFPVASPATGRLVAFAVTAGVLTDQAVRAGGPAVATAVLVAGVAVLLLRSGRLAGRQSQALAALAPVFGTWAAARTSPWLVPLDLLAAFGLLFLASGLATGGSLLRIRFSDLAARLVHGASHGLLAPLWLRPLVARRAKNKESPLTRHLGPVLVGLAVAVPAVALLGSLLASADAVFASFVRVRIPLSGESLVQSTMLIVVGAWVMLGLLRIASAEQPKPLTSVGWKLGVLEFTIALVAVEALFAAFAVAQVVALGGAGDRILRTAGLTYADYARSGFFQLIWVAVLTVAGLLALRALVDQSDAAQRRFRRLALVAILLTLLIVVTAVYRLQMYENAYGLTMLRLYSLLFAVWIGASLVLLAAELAGLGGGRSWFPAATIACGLAILLTLNVVNPEASVVRHNLNRSGQAVPVDAGYIADLSDDALPTLASFLPRLDPDTRALILTRICRDGGVDVSATGPAGWNLARARAERVRATVCAPATPL